MRTVARLAPLFVVACLLDCTSFPGIAGGTCGNGIVDPGEDCDTFPNGDGTSCRAAGGALACRLDCTKDAQGTGAACPSGWGCGTEGICRKPTGKFVAQQQSISAGAWRLSMGDFDGDKRKDVLTRQFPDSRGASKLRVHYFDGGAALAKTFVVAPAVEFPEVVRLTGDAIDDLTFNQPEGIGALLGQTDRALVPVAYPQLSFPSTVARVFTIRGTTKGPTAFLIWFKDTRQGSTTSIVADTETTASLLTVDGGPDTALGDTIIDDLVTDPAFPCDEVVFAMQKATSVGIWPACKIVNGAVDWNANGALIKIALQPGDVLDLGTRSADVDRDGHLDLLIGVVNGGTKATRVAYGTGTTFRSKPASDVTGEVGKAGEFTLETVNLGEAHSPLLPLAVGDISGDGRPDFVSPNRILTSNVSATGDGGVPLVVYTSAVEKNDVPWTQAVIADFNGNGFLDVIAGSDQSLDLDFFNGTGGVWLHRFSIPTNGKPSHFALGDTDGDLLPDLTYASGGSAQTGDGLAIVFGKPGGPPELPVAVGQFQRIVQTAFFKSRDHFGGQEPIVQIGVLSKPVDPKAPAVSNIARLDGSSDRQPLSLLGLAEGPSAAVPMTSMPAAFVQAGTIDVASVAQDRSPDGSLGAIRLWLVKGNGPASFQVALPGPNMPNEFAFKYVTDTSAGDALLQAAGDLDGDGASEVVIASPFGVFDGSKSALYIAKSVRKGNNFVFELRPPVLIDVMTTQEGQLQIVDVDRDGAQDIVLLTGVAEDRRSIVVYWNDGHGGIDAKSSLVATAKTEVPQSFAFATISADEPPALAFVTHTGVFIAHVDGKARSVRTEKIATTHEATGIAAGDVDGDGIDDLAIADQGNLLILRGQAVLP